MEPGARGTSLSEDSHRGIMDRHAATRLRTGVRGGNADRITFACRWQDDSAPAIVGWPTAKESE